MRLTGPAPIFAESKPIFHRNTAFQRPRLAIQTDGVGLLLSCFRKRNRPALKLVEKLIRQSIEQRFDIAIVEPIEQMMIVDEFPVNLLFAVHSRKSCEFAFGNIHASDSCGQRKVFTTPVPCGTKRCRISRIVPSERGLSKKRGCARRASA